MKTQLLPVHPVFGTALGLRRSGAPIWPIRGASTEGDPPAPDPVTVPPVPVVDETLGDGGTKALAAERQARKDAEKAQKVAEAQVKAFEDAQKTEGEKTAERIAKLEVDAAKALRYEAAEKAQISLALAARLKGNTLEELLADAEDLKKLIPAEAPATPPATPKPDRRQAGGQADPNGTMASGKALYEQRKQRT